ncbi:MAG: S9 family peptidase [Bacteroidetes bacterium]|nr:S9 family peptidase [Bacteroidota bacterium]
MHSNLKKYLHVSLVLVCSFLLMNGVSAQSGRLTPEKLWELGRVSLDDVSPDGSQVVYGITRYNLPANKGNRDLYLINSDGGNVKKITAFEGSESQARWRPDGKRIGFLSAESGSRQLWEMNPDGSDKKQVSDIEGGITGFLYSPSGDKILFTKNVKLDKTVNELYPDLPKANARIIDDLMYRHWDSWHDYEYSHVFFMEYNNGSVSGEPKDIMSGEPYDSPLNPFGGIEEIAWSPDGFTIAYTCKKLTGKEYAQSTNSEIYLYDLQADKTTNLTEGMNGYDKEPVFSRDGKYLAWNSMEKAGFESDRNRIFVMNMTSFEKTEITAGLDQDANHPQWSRDGKSIYFITGVQATYQIASIEIESRKLTQLTTGQHNYGSFAIAKNGIVASRMTMSEPSELFFIDFKKGEQKQITKTNEPILNSISMGKVEKRMIKTTDEKEMLTWVIYPPDFDSTKSYPTLLYCQGGPQSAVSQFFSYRWNFQLMAANGYIVVAPNRRGLPSFGRRWNDQISEDWGGQAMKDYFSAIDEVAKEDFVDNDRLGAVGASFGGYSVYWLAGNHEKRFKAFISHCGLFNMESWYGTTEELFFANHDIGGPYWELKPNATYKLHSPHLYVRNWDTPILVIHNEKDFRVPLGEGMQAFQAARLQDIPARFLYYPEEGHWVLQPQNGVLWHRVFFDWLERYLSKDEGAKDDTEGSGGNK